LIKNGDFFRALHPDDRSNIYAVTLARGCRAQRSFRSHGFATPHTAFGAGAQPQVPPDKTIAILRVEHGSVHETPYMCGRLPGGLAADPDCPEDR
jgi:hypothetical protein